MPQDLLVQTLLDRCDWCCLQADRSDAGFVPEAVRQLAAATTADQADAAYWRLDNRVVVQGRIYDSALALIPVLLALLGSDVWYGVRRSILDLLYEIQGGDVHEALTGVDPAALAAASQQAVTEGLWLYYHLLRDEHHEVRKTAVDLVGAIDQDAARRDAVLSAVAAADPHPEIRRSALWWLQR